MTTIENLKKEVDEIKLWLEDLKKKLSTMSEEDKQKKVEWFRTKIDATRQKIQAEINSLADKTDDASKKKKEEAETLLNSFEETTRLYSSIINPNEDTNTPQTTKQSQDIEQKNEQDKSIIEKTKNAYTKTKEWIWDQWDDVWNKEKWKEEWLKNTLRTAWFVATWVWAVALAYKWVKKLWNWAFWSNEEDEVEEETEEKTNKKKKKREKESSWWKKFLVGAWLAAWTVVGWVEVYKHRNRISSRFKEKLWLALSFDESIKKVEAEVRNWKVDDDHFWVFNAHFDWWITYDENTQEICSYWQKTKIEKNWKKLQWKDMEKVEFASREELIHAANIVNFAKRMLRWRWASSTPFWKTDRWGDIAFNCSEKWKQEFLSASNSNEWTRILGTLWTVGWWILWWYCAWVKWAAIWVAWWWTWWYALWAYIDNTSTAWSCCETICRWRNFDLFINYLNSQKDEKWKSLRESAWEQRIDPNETPINPVVDNWKEWSEWKWILAEIENTYWEDQSWRRNLQIERDPSNPTEYKIKSYNHELKMTVEWLPTKNWEKIDYSKIKKIHIEKYDKYDSRWDWLDIDFPHTEDWLKEAIKTANLTNMIVEDWKWKGAEAYPFAYGKYISKENGMSFNLDIDTPGMWSNWQWWTCVLWNSMIKERFPSLYKDLDDSRTLFIKWIPSQEDRHNQAVQDKSEWSQYIKFLHQIGKWKFWKKS